MEFAYLLGGGAPVVKKYLASEVVSVAGIVMESAIVTTAADGGSVTLPTADSAAANRHVGINIDTAENFPADPDGQTNAEANLYVNVIINPNAVFRAKMSGSAAADTALATSTPSGGGDAHDVQITSFVGGAIWGYTGGNAGIVRKADETDGHVGIGFPNNIATTDTYIAVLSFPGNGLATNGYFHDLTSDLTQLHAQTAAVTDTDNFVIVDGEFRDSGDDGVNNSYLHILSNHHLFGGNAALS